MPLHEFDARLETEASEGRDVAYFHVPATVTKELGSKGICLVKGTLNGHSFKKHLSPTRRGTHYMVVSKALIAACDLKIGSVIQVHLELDTEPRNIEGPPEFVRAINERPEALVVWNRLTRKEQKAIVRRLEVKTPAAMARKVAQAIQILTVG